MNYYEYIQSDAWRLVKERYQRSKLPQHCGACLSGWRPGFHLHHMTYKRLGHEHLTDLVMLCERCHDELHKAWSSSPSASLLSYSRKWIRRHRRKAEMARGIKLGSSLGKAFKKRTTRRYNPGTEMSACATN